MDMLKIAGSAMRYNWPPVAGLSPEEKKVVLDNLKAMGLLDAPSPQAASPVSGPYKQKDDQWHGGFNPPAPAVPAEQTTNNQTQAQAGQQNRSALGGKGFTGLRGISALSGYPALYAWLLRSRPKSAIRGQRAAGSGYIK